MTTQEIVKALRCCGEDESAKCELCPLCDEPLEDCCNMYQRAAYLIESMTAELEQAKQERDTWERRGEAVERDLHSIIRYAEDGCLFCAHHLTCAGKDCPRYMSGMGLTDPDGKEYPDWKWTCEDFEFGTCPLLENTPCNGCDFENHWQWRGPCAENGGTHAPD